MTPSAKRAAAPVVSPPRAAPRRVAVIVPAHNESRLIGRCLASLEEAARRLSTMTNAPEVRTFVVLDACDDDTAAVAGTFPDVHAVAIARHHVGAARRAGATAALRWPAGGCDWLASTDADSAVPADWLESMTVFARAGADMVLGTVDPAADLAPDIYRRWRRNYCGLDGHRHVHGANLGISGAAYRALGGWPLADTGEDVALVRHAEAAGYVVIRTGAIPVLTSGRLRGRAPAGFAAHLDSLANPVEAAP